MSKFIVVSSEDGRKAIVNVNNILGVMRSEDGTKTLIKMADEDDDANLAAVLETMEEMVVLLDASEIQRDEEVPEEGEIQ